MLTTPIIKVEPIDMSIRLNDLFDIHEYPILISLNQYLSKK
jgi:hypothetical protein